MNRIKEAVRENKRVIGAIMALAAVLAAIFLYDTKRSTEGNVFDRMIAEGYAPLTEAEHIKVGGYDALRLVYPVAEDPRIQIGLIYSGAYGKLYIYGDVAMPEDMGGMTYQEYFEKCMQEKGITWRMMEGHKEDFIIGGLLGPWFEKKPRGFSKDWLGDLEVIDYLMPFAYCGMEGQGQEKVTAVEEGGYEGLFEVKVRKTTWRVFGKYQCTHLSWDYNYTDILERIKDDINGLDSVNEYFTMTDEEGKAFALGECLDEAGLAEWLIKGGEVQGSLAKLSYRRGEGEERTREMLEKYHPGMLMRVIVSADYYIDNGYLYMRIPYYDYGAKSPGWLGNGDGQVWQGWLALRLEDIGEFMWMYEGENT